MWLLRRTNVGVDNIHPVMQLPTKELRIWDRTTTRHDASPSSACSPDAEKINRSFEVEMDAAT